MHSDRAIEIRDLRPADAALAAALHADGFGQDPWPVSAFSELLATPGTFGFLAFEAAAPLGFLLCRAAADECEILTITVLEAARRRSVGSLLLSHGLNHAAAIGVRNVFLEVAVDNAAAISLYRRAGFAQTAVRPAYYRRKNPQQRVDAAVMALTLEAGPEAKT
ncbi:GNAT family N-acetyltransferase [Denitrobaculum tricleocarpae]|uniref:GNAT family N-acetyltransferase n=1 Tax=Denitrobaculum tricleocarpae TaxID=2591009 RepID=A0A545TRQ7_9PROT|nr:GNAT family N-acetyltransferase [Denitrobaculum tricleocarpae]TQV79908.1 GNAT family N-acetyltransferase [Denitrobaculum tricleocarpae]